MQIKFIFCLISTLYTLLLSTTNYAETQKSCATSLTKLSLKTNPWQLYQEIQKHISQQLKMKKLSLDFPMGELADNFVSEVEYRLQKKFKDHEILEKMRQKIFYFISAIRQNNYPYIDILRLAEAYTTLRSCELNHINYYMYEKMDIKKSKTFKHDAELLLNFGHFFYWPSFDSMNLYEFIRSRSVPIYHLEVRDTPAYADGQLMEPISFLYHDKNHGREMAKADARLFSSMSNKVALKLLRSSWQDIETHISLAENSRPTKVVLFSYLHENYGYNLYEVLTLPSANLPLQAQALHFIEEELKLPLLSFKEQNKRQKRVFDYIKMLRTQK
ncbi:MAG: hypothetical protein KDD40_08660 [Bdellovibrionales bacterium]|nr:hypothetical protein [Bdellovibrionales bacterium]